MLFFLVPVRCRNCRSRFYRLRNPWLICVLAAGLAALVLLSAFAYRTLATSRLLG